ncbi:MAG: hypothetical protein K2X87_02710 [Gemmataceae bacterium]|nr:hypothetical protein [Gemmataceae bacterium]
MSCCLEYEPGVVLGLERAGPPAAEPVPADVWLSPADPAAYYYPSAGLALRRYYCPPGDEPRVLAELLSRPRTVSASLNYAGTTAAVGGGVGPAGTPRYFLDAELTGHTDDHDLLGGKGPPVRPVFDRLGVCQPPPADGATVVAVVDCHLSHARGVVWQLRNSLATATARPPTVLAVVTNLQSDLWTIAQLVLALCEVRQPIAVVNLSIDLGQLCGALAPGTADPLVPAAAVQYSFPFFTSCLDTFLGSRVGRQTAAPVVVAAAGNRSDGGRRWRLGYPASLPDVVAVTCSVEHPDGGLSPLVDRPAVGPLKPCFAADVAQFPPELKSRVDAGSQPDWTSYAAAAFSGRLAGSDPGPEPGVIAAIARLWGSGEDLTPVTDAGAWLPTPLRSLSPKRGTNGAPPSGCFRSLLGVLRTALRREFVLTGSAAFVERQAGKAARKTPRDLFECVGDLDLLYTGRPLGDDEWTVVGRTVREWAVNLAPGWEPPERWVSYHHIRTWAGPLYLFQCVIPDAQLFVTEGGDIGPWGIDATGDDGLPLVFVPPDAVWRLNPQVRGGTAGVADGLLIYLNRLALEARLRVSGVKGHPAWLGYPSGELIDRLRRRFAPAVDGLTGADMARRAFGDPRPPWTGREQPAPRLRGRIERVRQHRKSESFGSTWPGLAAALDFVCDALERGEWLDNRSPTGG